MAQDRLAVSGDRLIKRLGRLFVPGLADAVRCNRHRFGQLTHREDMPGGPHGHTRSIYLRWPAISDFESIIHGFVSAEHPAILEVAPFAQAVAAIEAALGRHVERALIIRLEPGGTIGEHIDGGTYADATDSFHLPIITNSKAWLQAGSERKHLERDVLYFFDKHAPHCGANEGAAERVHLVADTFR